MVSCLLGFGLILVGCNSEQKQMDYIRQELKKHDFNDGPVPPADGPLGGILTVSNQYPTIKYSFRFKNINKESIPKSALTDFDKQMTEQVCSQLPQLKNIIQNNAGADEVALFAQVLEADGVSFDFTFKDKIGRDIVHVNQKISDCHNFASLKNA